ncbi:conserved hypothetical protein [Methanosarcina acetivorans C2A]|uniref:Pyrrolo-quinoline quinone repeat domain-containing protein n=2 Tax=Methanosarcina acetivorans TaxID=2214 RepID=Q8TI66_METAC|nr:conserved hypothetical protein [Methanosarcina acetivorans C2A]
MNKKEKQNSPGPALFKRPKNPQLKNPLSIKITFQIFRGSHISAQAGRIFMKNRRYENMNKYTLTIFMICLTLLLVAAAQPALGSDWAQFQNDKNNSGVTADTAPIEEEDLANRSVDINAALDAAPVTGDGKVYEVAASGDVSAYYLNNWTLAWKNEEIQGTGGFELSTPAYNDGTLYVALSRGNASTHTETHALYTCNGSVKWSNTSLGTYQTNTPITYSNDRIFFGTANVDTISTTNAGDYYCFDASTGQFIWKRPSETSSGYYWAGAAVAGNYVIYGDDAGHVVSVEWNNVTDGVVWKQDEINVSGLYGVSGKIRSSICYSEEEGRIYFATRSGSHTCYVGFNATTGNFVPDDKDYNNIGYTSTPAVYNGRVYVGAGGWAQGAKLYCLNADTLDQIWVYTGSTGGIQGSPAISTYYDNGDGEVYIYFTNNGPSGSLYCLRDETGQTSADLQWTFTPDDATYTLQGPAISGGSAFFGNDNGYLYEVYTA